jgi:hypothetical protein
VLAVERLAGRRIDRISLSRRERHPDEESSAMRERPRPDEDDR